MKRLLALLLLAVAPAFAQELPVIYDPTIVQTYTPSVTPTTDLQNINQNSIGIPLTLYDDGTTYTPIDLQFDFYYFGSLFESVYISQNGFISFTSNANGCCSGNQLPFLSEDPYYNVNNTIFAMWSDLADFNNPGNPYYLSTANSFTVGWYNIDELGSPNKFTFEITLLADSSFSIAYGDFDYTMATGRIITSGYQGDTSNEYYTIYYGHDLTTIEGNTYTFASNASAPPPPPPPPPPPEEPEPPTPIAPDCTVNPNDPTCIINALIPDATDEEFLADTGFDNGSDDGSEPAVEDDPVEEEMFADVDPVVEEAMDDPVTEQSLEEMLAEESFEEEDLDEELVAAIEPASKELADEEKAGTLADSIGKDVLEAALSIAADVTAAGSVGGSESQSSGSSSSSSKTTNEMVASELASSESQVASASEQSENQMMESQQDAALDILETGRAMGQEALAATMSLTESSAAESLAEAESVASASVAETESSFQSVAAEIESSSTTLVADSSSTETLEDSQQQSIQQTQDSAEDFTTTETLVADSTQQDVQVQEEQQSMDQNPEQIVVQIEIEQQTDNTIVAQEETQSAVEFTDMSSVMENFMVTNNSQAAEQEELENSIIQQAIASSQTNEEENKMGFAEAEAVTIASDPALANAFNVGPNTASLELLGVLGSRAEEKSDAELRAEQVVAANKEQQDAINANYMEADQSGILAAIGSETDVTSYRTAMIRDNNVWYKPEDIYKGVIIKDNVRGSYFLEKGSTDTYKKMVEEQYKDE